MADLLSAATLLLTVITFLYSSWYGEIVEASKREIKKHAADRRDDYDQCRAVWMKTVFLSIVTTALFFINVPDSVRILLHAFGQITAASRESYSAVDTTYVVVEVVMSVLAAHLAIKACCLKKHINRLNPKRGDY